MNIKAAYRVLLRLYPADFRKIFADEMLSVFEKVIEDHGMCGTAVFLRLALTEMSGVLRGVWVEWNAKLAAEVYRTASLVGGSSLLAASIAKLIYTICCSNVLFTSRCVPDLRMMRPVGVSWDTWYGARIP